MFAAAAGAAHTSTDKIAANNAKTIHFTSVILDSLDSAASARAILRYRSPRCVYVEGNPPNTFSMPPHFDVAPVFDLRSALASKDTIRSRDISDVAGRNILLGVDLDFQAAAYHVLQSSFNTRCPSDWCDTGHHKLSIGCVESRDTFSVSSIEQNFPQMLQLRRYPRTVNLRN